MKTLVLYAHPAQQHSRVNAAMAAVANDIPDVSFVDLYAEYPRLNLDVEVEQQRLLDHDAIILQFPLMWYSTPPYPEGMARHYIRIRVCVRPRWGQIKGKVMVNGSHCRRA